jgi:hypothetical protein
LIAVDVNAASCILFPMVVGATQTKFLFFLKFAMVHAVGVVLASLFAFFAVFSVMGLLMAMLPARAFKRFSTYIRGVVVVYLVALLCTAFAVPNSLMRAGPVPAWTYLMPSCWFLGLCQSLRGRAGPGLMELSRLALPGVAAVVAIALCAYAVGYQRHFVRIAEIADRTAAARHPRTWRLGKLLDRLVLRTPYQRGCFRFVYRTLLRSEAHRLVLTAVGGLSLVLASQALMDAFANAKSWRQAALSANALSIPFIISFLVVVGLRLVFEIPAELRSNWIFQLMLDRDGEECEPLARKVILTLLLPGLLAITFPVYVYLEGWRVACLHTLLVTTWTVLLTNVVLIRFRKLPFTCTLPLFQQHSFVTLLSVCFGFLLYATSTPEFEASALAEPARMIGLIPVVAVAWYIPHHLAKSTIDIERKLIFEESPTHAFETLGLEDYGR